MHEQKRLIRWIKKHKAELIIAGFSIGALILMVIGLKNHEMIKDVWESLRASVAQPKANVAKTVTKVTVDIQPEPIQEIVTTITSNSDSISYEVSRHIRNLPEGWHASPEKIASALEKDIHLMDGQTWVDSYMKGGVAA